MIKVRDVTIAVIEDHPLFREGLVHLLQTERGFRVVLQAESAETALTGLAALADQGKSPVSCIILDLSLKESSGLDLLKDLVIRYPAVPVLVVSMHDEEYYAERVMAAGGRGYVMKQEDPDRIIEAVKVICSGGNFYLRSFQPSQTDPVGTLTERELSVFGLVSQGVGTKEIAAALSLSVKTVETHKEHIKTKLGQATAADLLKFAIEWRRSRR